MMNPNFYIGKSLDDLAKRTGHNHSGYAVYLLANPSDTTGWLIGEDYSSAIWSAGSLIFGTA